MSKAKLPYDRVERLEIELARTKRRVNRLEKALFEANPKQLEKLADEWYCEWYDVAAHLNVVEYLYREMKNEQS